MKVLTAVSFGLTSALIRSFGAEFEGLSEKRQAPVAFPKVSLTQPQRQDSLQPLSSGLNSRPPQHLKTTILP